LGSRYYGRLKRSKAYSKLADLYLLPHISQWYVLLTPFTFPDRRTVVKADVLMTDDTLYSGDVIDHFLDKDGNLSGLFLANPARFDRRRYLKEKDTWGTTRPTATYWRPIPSAKLYLLADKIVNLNLNYEPPTAIPDVVARYLSKLQKRPIAVSVTEPLVRRHMPISYEITRLPDGRYECIRIGSSGKASSTLSFTRSDLEGYLRDSVSNTRLEEALRTLDSTGSVTVEADLET